MHSACHWDHLSARETVCQTRVTQGVGRGGGCHRQQMMERVCWLLGSPLFVALCVAGLREAFDLRCLAVDRGWVVGGEMAASVAVEGCLRLRLYLRQCRTKQVVWCCGADWDGWVDGWVSTSMQAVSFVLGCLSCLWVICIRGCLCCDMSWQCFTSSSYVHIHTFICYPECFTAIQGLCRHAKQCVKRG